MIYITGDTHGDFGRLNILKENEDEKNSKGVEDSEVTEED